MKVGTAKTIADFYYDCIEPALIPKENAIAWHKMLMQYIELDDVDIISAEIKATYDEIKRAQLWMP